MSHSNHPVMWNLFNLCRLPPLSHSYMREKQKMFSIFFSSFCSLLLKNVASSQHLSTPNFLIIRFPLFISHFHVPLCATACNFPNPPDSIWVSLLLWTLLTASFRHLFGIVQVKLGILLVGRQRHVYTICTRRNFIA